MSVGSCTSMHPLPAPTGAAPGAGEGCAAGVADAAGPPAGKPGPTTWAAAPAPGPPDLATMQRLLARLETVRQAGAAGGPADPAGTAGTSVDMLGPLPEGLRIIRSPRPAQLDASGRPTVFALVSSELIGSPMRPGAANTAYNLEQHARVISVRADRLERALAMDQAAQGEVDPAHHAQLAHEQAKAGHLQALAAKVASFGPSLTEAEAGSLYALAAQTRGAGSMDGMQLARTLFAIEARIGSYAPAATQAMGSAYDLLAQHQARLAGQSGQVEPGTMSQLDASATSLVNAHAALTSIRLRMEQDPAIAAALGARVNAAVAAAATGGLDAFAASLADLQVKQGQQQATQTSS